jgi:hypothetical protein
MKLYAKATSERTSKGQGGNEYIDIKLTVQGGHDPKNILDLGIVRMNVNTDGTYTLALDRSSVGRETSGRVYEEIIDIQGK